MQREMAPPSEQGRSVAAGSHTGPGGKEFTFIDPARQEFSLTRISSGANRVWS